MPSEFDLDIPQKGRTYRAKLMWRDAAFIGVQFVQKAARDSAQTETALTKLEQENKRLKATIAILTRRLEALGQDVSADEMH